MLEVLRSGRLSLGPALGAVRGAFAARIGAPHASAVSSGTAGLHLALRAVGVSDGTEVITSPFSFVASANVAVYERARPVFADIDPVTLNLDPDAAAAAITDRTAALMPVHIFGYPADLPAFERLGRADRRGRLRGAGRGPRRRDRGRRSRASGGVRLLRQQAADDRRGRHGHDGRRRAQGADRLRAKPGPRAGHGLARPRPAGVQLPAVGHRMRAGAGTARAPRRDARRAAPGWPTHTATRSPASRGCSCPVPMPDGNRRGWFVFVVQLPRGRRSRRLSCERWRELGIPSKPYFPAVHLMTYYRRAVRPPRGRVSGVRGRRCALDRAAVLPADDRGPGRARGGGAAAGTPTPPSALEMSRFSEPQHPAFRALNDSIAFDRRLAPYDVAQSRAHAAMLASRGIISDDERDELHRGLDQVQRELDERLVPVRRRRRGHPHGDRAAR